MSKRKYDETSYPWTLVLPILPYECSKCRPIRGPPQVPIFPASHIGCCCSVNRLAPRYDPVRNDTGLFEKSQTPSSNTNIIPGHGRVMYVHAVYKTRRLRKGSETRVDLAKTVLLALQLGAVVQFGGLDWGSSLIDGSRFRARGIVYRNKAI